MKNMWSANRFNHIISKTAKIKADRTPKLSDSWNAVFFRVLKSCLFGPEFL